MNQKNQEPEDKQEINNDQIQDTEQIQAQILQEYGLTLDELI